MAVLRYIGSVMVRGTVVSDMKKKVALSVYKRLKVVPPPKEGVLHGY